MVAVLRIDYAVAPFNGTRNPDGTLFDDSKYPIPAALETLHDDELDFASPRPARGERAAERTAIAASARAAQCEARNAIADRRRRRRGRGCGCRRQHAASRARSRSAGPDIDREFCAQAQSDGLAEGAYVEIVSVASRLTNLDVFARGIGVSGSQAARAGYNGLRRRSPVRQRRRTKVSIPRRFRSYPEGGELAKSLYGRNPGRQHHANAEPRSGRGAAPDPDCRRAVLHDATVHGLLDTTGRRAHPSTGRARRDESVSEHNACFY